MEVQSREIEKKKPVFVVMDIVTWSTSPSTKEYVTARAEFTTILDISPTAAEISCHDV
jgi:hypothetical protein